MNLYDYIERTEPRYEYRIKSLIPLDDAALDKIERVIMKYKPLDMTRPRRLVFQNNPPDFPNAGLRDIWVVDVALGMIVAGHYFHEEIRYALGCKADEIAIRQPSDPLEIQADDAAIKSEMDMEAKTKDLRQGPLLDVAPDYPEGQKINPTDYYGDEYNKRLVGYLSRIAREQAEKRKVDAPSSLFRWLDLPKPDVEQATPEPMNADREDVMPPNTGSMGQLDMDSRRYARIYSNRRGIKTVLSTDVQGIRK